MKMTNQELIDKITEYLSAGGLFNPEFMEHDKVRDTLIEIREFLQKESSPPTEPEGSQSTVTQASKVRPRPGD